MDLARSRDFEDLSAHIGKDTGSDSHPIVHFQCYW